MKVSELTGALLDYWVAKTAGRSVEIVDGQCQHTYGMRSVFSPSTNWSQGGPIIEREGMNQYRQPDGIWYVFIKTPEIYSNATGATLLIAAMRCYVASKFGNELPE